MHVKARTRALLVVPTMLTLTFAAGVGPAAAAPSPNANCVAQDISLLNSLGGLFGVHGLGGRVIAQTAKNHGMPLCPGKGSAG